MCEDTRDEFQVVYIGPFVNVYLMDRVYGGPEEGGWWYDTGRAIRSKQYPTQAKAEYAKEVEQAWCDETNKAEGRRYDLSSVLCIGKYVVYVEDEPGADFPSQIPHYE